METIRKSLIDRTLHNIILCIQECAFLLQLNQMGTNHGNTEKA